MKILIVGLGSIGKKHLKNIRFILPDAKITIWRHRKPTRTGEIENLADHVVYSAKQAIASKADAAIIANPAPYHIKTALALANNGTHLFIEKPLANSMAKVDELISICKKNNLTLLVGYIFRFYPVFQKIKEALQQEKIGRLLSIRAEVGQYLPDWRPGQDYRQTVSARQSLGGGALLELSHEIDYVRWFAGEITSVFGLVAKVSDLELDVDDMAEIILRCQNGTIASIHLDMFQRTSTRTCRLIGTEGTIQWNWQTHESTMYLAADKTWQTLTPAREIDINDLFIDAMRHFIACVEGKDKPLVDGHDGKIVLQIALATLKSSQSKREISL